MYQYKLYGLSVSSCLNFNFLERQTQEINSDITIIESNKLISYKSDKINMDVAILNRKNVACFKIVKGKKILFHRENPSIREEII